MFGLIVGVLKVAALVATVVDAGVSICRHLGILKPETKTEDLGDRAMQAREAGIRAEDYDGRFDEYKEKIENFEIDPEKSKTYSPADKIQAAGEIVGWGLTEHYGKASGVEDFIRQEFNKHDAFYTPERAEQYMEAFKEGGMDKIGPYLDNRLNNMQDIKTIDVKLTEAEEKLGVSEEEAKERLDQEIERRANA